MFLGIFIFVIEKDIFIHSFGNNLPKNQSLSPAKPLHYLCFKDKPTSASKIPSAIAAT